MIKFNQKFKIQNLGLGIKIVLCSIIYGKFVILISIIMILKIMFFSIMYFFFLFYIKYFLNHNVKRFMLHTLITIIILHIILFS
jgi:hypothetical protein